MDSLKLKFLQAVVGVNGAEALFKASERSKELGGAIFPIAITSWLQLVGDFTGKIPGTEISVSLKKSAERYDGHVSIGNDVFYLTSADIYRVAGAVAVAIGADSEQVDPEVTPRVVASLSKSIDLLAKTNFVKVELAKTSWNAKARRLYQFKPGSDKPILNQHGNPKKLSQKQVEDRRLQYARSLGLDPVKSHNSDKFPEAKGNKLPYGGIFDLAHEASHAMMTPSGDNIADYQKFLSTHAEPKKATDEDLDDIDTAHEDAVHDENVANAIEPHFDRRAGVDPHAFAGDFRGNLVTPKGYDNYEHYSEDEPDYGKATPAPKQYREDAKHYIDKIDSGSRFTPKGNLVGPKGIEARINARAAGERPRTKFAKDEKAPKPKTGVVRPGPQAAPWPPEGPTQPQAKQAKMNNPIPGSAATSPAKMSSPVIPGTGPKAAGAPSQARAPKAPGGNKAIKVLKSQAYTKCGLCGGSQFKGANFQGCICFKDLAKSVSVKETKTHFELSFGPDLDQDAIETLILTFRT